jgi:ABC-type multidrug transport system ATPase subunit
MTALELLNYHQKFKSFKAGWTSELVLEKIGLSKAAHKQIRYFSSGMKQRLKLAQAFFSTTPLLLLDEPCTNLDQAGIDLYLWLLQNLSTDRIIIISSNDPIEYPQNSHTIHLGV